MRVSGVPCNPKCKSGYELLGRIQYWDEVNACIGLVHAPRDQMKVYV